MKDLIISIIILSALIAGFSFYGDKTPYQFPPKEGWAFSEGTGAPIPKDGEKGGADVFTLGAEAQQTSAEEKTGSPISVSTAQKTAQQPQEQTKHTDWQAFIAGVCAGAVAVEIILTIVLLTRIWLTSRKRRKRHEKRKSRTHTPNCLP